MARKKEISKQKIFNAAYKLALHDGIDVLTARNIAKAVHCSTQPIYLEFKNMTDLRNQVLEQLAERLETTTLQRSYLDEPILDYDLSFIYFAQEAPALFKSIFVENKFGKEFVSHVMLNLGTEKLGKQLDLHKFSDHHVRTMVINNWIVINGLANLALNQLLDLDQDQIVALLRAQLHSSMLHDQLSKEESQLFVAGEAASLAKRLS